ncbi:relaxase domain-containing protein [Acidithiobacillus ferrivorans]|nr:relaxase domain-containing protein [Acidithiobacillus ferrivorans]
MSVKETHLSGSPASVTKYVSEEKELHKSRSGEQYTTGYYSESSKAPSMWMGKGAEIQGLSGAINSDDLERLLSGVTMAGEDISGRGGHDKERRMGSDFTFSAPKAASIIGIADERVKQWMLESVQETVDEYFSKEMVYARVGKGGAVSEYTENVAVAAYLHEAARAADGTIDPQLHIHAVAPSMIQRADGKWVAARYDYGENNQKIFTLGDIQTAKLMGKMQAAGYDLEARLEKDDKGIEHLSFGARGISREAEEQFSGRKKQINEYLKANGIDPKTATRAQKDAAALNTRAAKDKNIDSVDLKYEQRARAREAGVDLGEIRENANKRAATSIKEDKERSGTPSDDHQITGADVIKSALRHLGERDEIVTRTALIAESVKIGAGYVDYKDILRAMDDREGGLVRVDDRDRDGTGKLEQNFTTKSAIYREAEILHRAREGQGKADALIDISEGIKPVVPKDVSFTEQELEDGKPDYGSRNDGNRAGSKAVNDKVSSVEEIEPFTQHRLRSLSERSMDADQIREDSSLLQGDASADGHGLDDLRRPDDDSRVIRVISDFEQKKGFTLGDGQKAAVALALTTQDRHVGIVGAAGAGKTTSMELIVEQYRAAGYEIIGVAPSAAAAHELKSAGCDDTRTLASALLKQQKEDEQGGKKLYILDEAGMVSAKDMDAFLQKADNEGAKTILVGDPLQLAAVEAGSPFAQLLKTGAIAHANIDEIQRQKDPQLREIAQAFARGDAATGVELAKPYMRQVQATDQDYAEAALKKDEAQAAGGGSDVKATEKMMKFAENHDYKGSDSCDDVRKFLDEKAYYVGLGASAAEQQGPKAPAEVRKIALARAAADAYLALSPEEREKTLMLAATNQTRRMINEKVREGMKAEGSLGDGMTISALDKLDVTRERATRAVHYAAKDPDDAVIVQFNREFKDADGNVIAAKGSQWRVTDNGGGKLSLQSFANQDTNIQIDPAKAKLNAFAERKMELAVGDQVMFRQNDKEKGVLNGTQGKVIGIDKEAGVVFIKTDQGMLAIDARKAESLDYSYARTIHSSQGATVDRTILVGEAARQAMAELAYVGCSREKIALTIITDDMDRLMKAWSKFAEKHFAMDAARAKAPESYEELQKARQEADRESGGVGDLAKKRAAQQALQEQAPAFIDMPDAMDPDLGSDKFTQKVDAAMEKVAENADAARDSDNTAATGQAPAAEPVAETPAPAQTQPEPELELSD